MRIAVIGNGGTAVDIRGLSHIDRHTANFLFNLAESGFEPCFIQPKERLGANANFHDCSLSSGSVVNLGAEACGF